jgi:hypothetical protein
MSPPRAGGERCLTSVQSNPGTTNGFAAALLLHFQQLRMELITLAGVLVFAVALGVAGSRAVLWAVLCGITRQIV